MSVSDGQSNAVIGFTEAELGLTLAVLFLTLWIGSLRQHLRHTAPPKPVETARITADSLSKLLARNAALQVIVDSLKLKRSSLAPPCSEVHAAEGPIGTVTVIGSDQFRADGKVLSISALDERFAVQQAAAALHRCRQQIVVRVDPTISAASYNTGLTTLRRRFYTILGVQ